MTAPKQTIKSKWLFLGAQSNHLVLIVAQKGPIDAPAQ